MLSRDQPPPGAGFPAPGSRRRTGVAAPADSRAALILGGPRRGAGTYLGLGILLLATALMTAALWEGPGEGPWPPLAIWPVAALVALFLLTTRELRIAPDGVVVTRHLLGLRWSRRHGRARFRAVGVRCDLAPTRHSRWDGTPEGELPLLMFTATLVGRPRLTLDFDRDADRMEGLARRAATLLELPAVRRGYVRRPRGGLPVRVRKGAEEPLA